MAAPTVITLDVAVMFLSFSDIFVSQMQRYHLGQAKTTFAFVDFACRPSVVPQPALPAQFVYFACSWVDEARSTRGNRAYVVRYVRM